MHRLALAAALLATACSSSETEPASSTTGTGTGAGTDVTNHVFGGDRPVGVFRAPEGADPSEPLPLVVVLHGYGASGLVQTLYFHLDTLVDSERFLLAAPDGLPSDGGPRFWAAVDDCCASGGAEVDDVAYLTGLVEEIASVWTVDPKRVYVVGHSNGGAMGYRLACEPGQPFAAALLLAPAFFADATDCEPTAPISIRHVHGTADETVAYDGGSIDLLGPALAYVSAPEAVGRWAELNGCDAAPNESAPPIDLDGAVDGPETTTTSYPACAGSVATELLTMAGSTHVPMDLTPEIGELVWGFLDAHPRP